MRRGDPGGKQAAGGRGAAGTTAFAPLCSIRWAFSSSATAATMRQSGLSSRAVSETSTAVSSPVTAMTTVCADSTPAWTSTERRLASPSTAAMPRSLAVFTAPGSMSTATSESAEVPWPISSLAAARPRFP